MGWLLPCALRQKTFVRRRLFASVAPPEGRLEFNFRPNNPQNYAHASSLFCRTQYSSIAPTHQGPIGGPHSATPMCTWHLTNGRYASHFTLHCTAGAEHAATSSISPQRSSYEPARAAGYSFSFFDTNLSCFIILFPPADGWSRPWHLILH